MQSKDESALSRVGLGLAIIFGLLVFQFFAYNVTEWLLSFLPHPLGFSAPNYDMPTEGVMAFQIALERGQYVIAAEMVYVVAPTVAAGVVYRSVQSRKRT